MEQGAAGPLKSTAVPDAAKPPSLNDFLRDRFGVCSLCIFTLSNP